MRASDIAATVASVDRHEYFMYARTALMPNLIAKHPSRRRLSGRFMSGAEWDRLWRRDFLTEDNKRVESRRLYVDWISELLQDVDCRGASSVELGCGTGLVTRGLFDRLGLSSAVLVDFSREALAIAAANAQDRTSGSSKPTS